jgi:hypothetical protein
MTTTSPTVTVIKKEINLFMSQEMTQDIIYALMIQSFTNDEVFFSLISYASSIVSQQMLRELQGLKIDKNVSIPGV